MKRETKQLTDPLRTLTAFTDGREIDPAIGALEGEGAEQRVKGRAGQPVPDADTRAAFSAEGPSYHGMPVLKAPVWTWEIPAYFFAGGLAGATAVLGAAAHAAGGSGTPRLVSRCRLVSAGAAAASAALLIDDLGRPSRFLNMLRVFRPTSPMNMGTWLLSGFGACAGVAALPEALVLAGREPPRGLRRAANAAAWGSAALGLPLVGYTGVLLSDTAVPVWQSTRNTLPMLFAFSGAVSAGGLFELFPLEGRAREMTRRFGLVAKGGELALSRALHREAGAVPRVEKPLREGPSGRLLTASRWLLIASAVADLWPGRSRSRRIASGLCALAGTLGIRYGIAAAGKASAADPHATFELQRAGRGGARSATEEGRPAMPSLPGIDATGKESVRHGHGAPA